MKMHVWGAILLTFHFYYNDYVYLKVNFSGVMINMGAWVREHSYKSLLHAASAFESCPLFVINM